MRQKVFLNEVSLNYIVINRTLGKSTNNGHLLRCGWGRPRDYTSSFLFLTSTLLRKVHITIGGSQMVCWCGRDVHLILLSVGSVITQPQLEAPEA